LLTVRRPEIARTTGGRSSRTKARRERGFIITLELIVLMSVFGVVFLFAMSTLQEWIVNQLGDYFGNKIYVFDSTQPAGSSQFVGRAVGFDNYGAPLVVIRDTSLAPPPAAILGVRSPAYDPVNGYPSPSYGLGGFTSRMRVYYRQDNCTGEADLLNVFSGDWGTQRFTPDINGYDEPVQDVYPLQSVAYAIGASQVLYRSQDPVALGSNTFGATKRINSYYDSSAYPQGQCYNLGIPEDFITYPGTGCPANRVHDGTMCYPTLKRMVTATAVVTMAGPGGVYRRPLWIPSKLTGTLSLPSGGGTPAGLGFTPATNEGSAPTALTPDATHPAPTPEGGP